MKTAAATSSDTEQRSKYKLIWKKNYKNYNVLYEIKINSPQ